MPICMNEERNEKKREIKQNVLQVFLVEKNKMQRKYQ